MGNGNTASGIESLFSNYSGSRNTANGYQALYFNISGDYNTASGYRALFLNTSGYSNIALGPGALYKNTVRANLVAIGDSALFNNGNGASIPAEAIANTAVGSKALYSNTTGSNNTANGYQALYSNTTGTFNTATGKHALYSNTEGQSNSANGNMALYSNNTGSWNTACGGVALVLNISGNNNTAIGYNTGPNSTNYDNTTCLGIDATATGSDMVRIGNTFIGSIGGQVGWTTLSDGRFKENVKEDVPGLSFIRQLRPVTYQINREKINEFTGMNDKRNMIKEQQPGTEFQSGDKYSAITTGFLAQEVETAAKSIGFDFSGVDAPKNENDMYGLRYAEFVVPLVKAVQELNQKNEILENFVKTQQQAIDIMKIQNEQLVQRIEKLEAK
jgi:hypothetical protein